MATPILRPNLPAFLGGLVLLVFGCERAPEVKPHPPEVKREAPPAAPESRPPPASVRTVSGKVHGKLVVPGTTATFNKDWSRGAHVSGGSLFVRDVTTNRELLEGKPLYEQPVGSQLWVNARTTDLSPDGAYVAIGSDQRAIRGPKEEEIGLIEIWEVAKGAKSGRLFKAHRDVLFGLAYRPDGKRLASAGADKTVKIWDPSSGNEIVRLENEQGTLTAGQRTGGRRGFLTYSPDGELLGLINPDCSVRIWNTATTKELLRLNDVGCVELAISPDNKRLATILDSDLRIWDIAKQSSERTFKGKEVMPGRRFTQIAYSPDGRWLAVAGTTNQSKDGWGLDLKVWNAATYEVAFDLTREKGIEEFEITRIAFSSDSSRVFALVARKVIYVWDLNSRP